MLPTEGSTQTSKVEPNTYKLPKFTYISPEGRIGTISGFLLNHNGTLHNADIEFENEDGSISYEQWRETKNILGKIVVEESYD